jgi:hypothetical protein
MKINIEALAPGTIFYSKYLVNKGVIANKPLGASIPIKVVSIDKHITIVDWGSGGGEDDWNTQHILYAFERGDYSFKPFK